MPNLRKTLFLAAIALFTFGCKTETKQQQSETQAMQEVKETTDFTGNYVSDGYEQRNEGYDWVAVTVSTASNDQLKISIRSRADKKKPTCTFDTLVQKIDESTYQTLIDGKEVVFRFNESNIVIETKKEDDNSILYFYCSGGATLAGTYTKINQQLDEDQIDKTQFSKVLTLQDIGFNVSAIEKNGENQLMIFTFGLPQEFDETIAIQNQVVTHAEVEDLNSDGSPELLVFTEDSSSDRKGNVYGFSVNNKNSMSAVYFQPTTENKEINAGYKGSDEFALVETSLVQRFPIYENGKQTGKIKQIEYKLEDGEAMRRFVVKNQTEYPL